MLTDLIKNKITLHGVMSSAVDIVYQQHVRRVENDRIRACKPREKRSLGRPLTGWHHD
jgi:hypothetical protein